MEAFIGVAKDLQSRKRQTWAFVNNHEGSAPLTIEPIKGKL
jgi:hypothetical protein